MVVTWAVKLATAVLLWAAGRLVLLDMLPTMVEYDSMKLVASRTTVEETV